MIENLLMPGAAIASQVEAEYDHHYLNAVGSYVRYFG